MEVVMAPSNVSFSSGALIGALVAAGLLGGVWFAKASGSASEQAPALTAQTQQLPPNHPPMGAMGMAPQAQPVGGPVSVTGEILEVTQVPSYTYLRLKTESGEVWAAVPTVDVKVGQSVGIANATTMNGFTSKTLGKTFDSILFGSLAAQ